ncbi:Initiation-specific alpha-1,6-mannosyltransferase [Cytospora mali]|uniref:Initiation-specific alpha-1,6-mannosyltransferase n=1 Tax=Cytospora mali TaxID=578113 RepID=A0A194W7V3_CYTMA|nr:Initiation-specific alpha-1,6-mannosyltransferase [Valsa mali]
MSPLRIRHGCRLIAAPIWVILTVLAILIYWRRHTSASNNAQRQGGNKENAIPNTKKIWQITGDSKIQPARACAEPWITTNPGWAHTLHTDTTAVAFAERHWGSSSNNNNNDDGSDGNLARALGELRNVGIRADLIRYLLLGAEGGMYTDLDTVPLRQIDAWLPWGEYLDRGARLVVGVEWDELATSDGSEGDSDHGGRPKGVLHEVQFCQWTIVSLEAGHPVFKTMIDRALALLGEHRAFWGARTLGQVVFSEQEVLNITGPAAWTEVVLGHMRSVDPDGLLGGLRGLSRLREPRLVGDVLVLPVDAFASGMAHSGSTREEDGVPEMAMVKHLFRGSWREGNKGSPLC